MQCPALVIITIELVYHNVECMSRTIRWRAIVGDRTTSSSRPTWNIHRNITKWLVAGAAVHTIHTPAATQDNLENGRHQHVTQAAYLLRSTLGVGSQFDLEDYRSLDEHWRDLIDCEADHTSYCN